MKRGQQHLVKCRCVLPQYKRSQVQHKFIVFSILDDDKVIDKLVQCPNCGIVHKVVDICESVIMNGKEQSTTIISIDDIRSTIDDRFVVILDKNRCDLPVWENVKFIIDEKQWGSTVVISSETNDGIISGKILTVLGEKTMRIDTFSRVTSA